MESWRLYAFWSKVDRSGECWLWTACRDSAGYGRFRVNKAGKLDGAHRISYEIAHGPIPKGMLVCHVCDVKTCVKPSHLFLGTDKDNAYDYYTKYGHPTNGERNGMVKLTRNQVKAIRILMASKQFKPKHIAPIFNISKDYVYSIAKGTFWRHVYRP